MLSHNSAGSAGARTAVSRKKRRGAAGQPDRGGTLHEFTRTSSSPRARARLGRLCRKAEGARSRCLQGEPLTPSTTWPGAANRPHRRLGAQPPHRARGDRAVREVLYAGLTPSSRRWPNPASGEPHRDAACRQVAFVRELKEAGFQRSSACGAKAHMFGLAVRSRSDSDRGLDRTAAGCRRARRVSIAFPVGPLAPVSLSPTSHLGWSARAARAACRVRLGCRAQVSHVLRGDAKHAERLAPV